MKRQEKSAPSDPNAPAFAAELGLRIRRARIERGQTQAELSKALGVSSQQLHKYETGANVIPLHRLLKIASLYSLPPEAFWQITPLTSEPSDGGDASLLLLVRTYKRISNPRIKHRLLRLVKEIAGEDGPYRR